jgi:spore photoproduct lyase
LKYFDWKKVFDYFKNSDRDMGTLASKFISKELLSYDSQRKIRVRMSLMPEKLSEILEPKTSKIKERIKFMNSLYEAGYEVHVNFSPVVIFNKFLDYYEELFDQMDIILNKEVKDQLKAEIIFLTHNEKFHLNNQDLHGEKLLWVPRLQENKKSQFGGSNVRYKYELKRKMLNLFIEKLKQKLPYIEVRYAF